jgi:hypothetical protein
MESSRVNYLLFKYLLLFLGIIIMTIPVVSFLFPESISINEKNGPADATTTLISVLVGILIILIFYVIKDRFVIVELNNQTIKIIQGTHEETVTWPEVDSIAQFRFIRPPLYKLRTKVSDKAYWFNTTSDYISMGGFTSDISDMGALIKKKKRELGI